LFGLAEANPRPQNSAVGSGIGVKELITSFMGCNLSSWKIEIPGNLR
jgi:hypothetical protein